MRPSTELPWDFPSHQILHRLLHHMSSMHCTSPRSTLHTNISLCRFRGDPCEPQHPLNLPHRLVHAIPILASSTPCGLVVKPVYKYPARCNVLHPCLSEPKDVPPPYNSQSTSPFFNEAIPRSISTSNSDTCSPPYSPAPPIQLSEATPSTLFSHVAASYRRGNDVCTLYCHYTLNSSNLLDLIGRFPRSTSLRSSLGSRSRGLVAVNPKGLLWRRISKSKRSRAARVLLQVSQYQPMTMKYRCRW